MMSASKGQPATLTCEQFEEAAQEYAQLQERRDGHRLGESMYAVGWQWRQGPHPPHTRHLFRTLDIPTSKSEGGGGQAIDVEAWDGEGEWEEERLAEADDVKANSDDRISIISLHQSVVFSSTWRVPVLYLDASKPDGSPLPIGDLHRSRIFLDLDRWDASDADHHTTNRNGVDHRLSAFPKLSMGENPASGRASLYLHPCQTAASLSTLMHEEQGAWDKLAYLKAFMMLCSTVVQMRSSSDIAVDQMEGHLSGKSEALVQTDELHTA